MLYGASSMCPTAAASPSATGEGDQPAHLEWHNSEAKWRAKEPPKRVIVLKVGRHRWSRCSLLVIDKMLDRGHGRTWSQVVASGQRWSHVVKRIRTWSQVVPVGHNLTRAQKTW